MKPSILTPAFATVAKAFGSQEQPLEQSWQRFDEIQQLDPPAPAQTLEPPAQQQQTDPQQQQPPQSAPADPFAGIDMDMLDDDTRKSVETARQQFATIAKERDQVAQQLQHTEAQRREFQSQIDRVNSQLQQAQRGQAPKEPTMAEALADYYQQNANLPPEQAKRAAETMSGVFQIFGKQFEQNLGRQFAPIANASLQNTATQVFGEVRDSDPTGAMLNPAIAQKVWDAVSRLTESGQIPDVELVNNIKRIHMASAIEDGSWSFQPPPQQQPQTPPYPASIPGFQMPKPNMQNPFPAPQPQPANPSTRFTFPGANPGNIRANGSPPPGVRGGGGSPLDPETAAAVAATTGQWRKTKK